MKDFKLRLTARAIFLMALIVLIIVMARCGSHNQSYPLVINDMAVPKTMQPVPFEMEEYQEISNVQQGEKERALPQILETPDEDLVFEFNLDISPIEFNTEEYNLIVENDFKKAWDNPISTFSIDVDKASYTNIRRYLSNHRLPPKDAVRIEEMINYFDYGYPQPMGPHPFSITTDMGECPWNKSNKLVHIGIQGRSLNFEDIKQGNYVFLIDVSGSMNMPDKLPLVKKSMEIMLDHLHPDDKVAIVVYAGAAGLVLPSTPANQEDVIRKAINKLSAGGSTAGGAGIKLAYKIAMENKIADGNNRIILATDGDFNVGVSSTSELVRMVEEKRKEGIYLTICGYGMGNYKDGRLEQISAAGNGVYFYIDNIREAERVFGRDLRANLFTIARDVKVQVEFNPLQVHSYRLIGYENRLMAKEDFDDDEKDAGELGAGHSVTALYEIVPANENNISTSSLRYQESYATALAGSGEWLTLKLRYKPLNDDKSILIENQLFDNGEEMVSSARQFAQTVAAFGLLLRDSKYKGDLTFEMVLNTLRQMDVVDEQDKWELLKLVETASLLSNRQVKR
jgi:Ca-activated chloride channel homolog